MTLAHAAIADEFLNWLRADALPLWAERGVDRKNGGFHEKLAPDGSIIHEPRRARLCARQIYAFSMGAALGWQGPAEALVAHGLDWLEWHHLDAHGDVTLTHCLTNRQRKGAFDLYDCAFVLFALAEAARFPRFRSRCVEHAARIRIRLLSHRKHLISGFEVASEDRLPLRSNPHMHMLEACLAWERRDEDPAWAAISDEIASLCLKAFICPETGALHEHFDDEWGLLCGEGIASVEPGHQCEWAWLLTQWGHTRGRTEIPAVARLMKIAEGAGRDPTQNLLVNELGENLAVRDRRMRLWPQTERLKALCLAPGRDRDQIDRAVGGLMRFFDHPVRGAWWEHIAEDGQPISEPTRASSLYHIVCAAAELDKYLTASSTRRS